jgi:hypothetical protein
MVAKKETVNKITQEGYDALVAELQELQKKRPEIVNEIEKPELTVISRKTVPIMPPVNN